MAPALASAEGGLAYPSKPEIAQVSLDPARASLLNKLINLSARTDFKPRQETREQLCPKLLHKPDPAQLAVKAALTVVEADMYTEVVFQKGSGPGVDTKAEKFSLLVNFDDSSVLVRLSAPRFATEAQGLSIRYPGDHTRPMWLEGKDGTNVLVLIPTVKDCSAQAIVVCSRTYDPRGALVQSKYEPIAARYFITTKGDGLFSAPSDAKGKIVASVLGSVGVPLPSPWSKEDVASGTPSVTFKNMTPPDSQHPFSPIKLPAVTTVESRLDFGTESLDQRTVWARSTVEISEFALDNWPNVHVRTADLKVESGRCFQITTWNETQY